MSDQPAWLKRLEDSTSYQQLHDVFIQIVKHAQENLFSSELGEHLDAALSKISAELNRDIEKRKQTEGELTSTKAANKGVVGWLKRTMPFSDARKQIDAQQQSIEIQAREIWADKLLILRLQLLKELSLPSDTRSLGRRPQDWQKVLSPLTEFSHLAQLAELAQGLRADVAAAQPLLARYQKAMAESDAELAVLEPTPGPTDKTLAQGMDELQALGLKGSSAALPQEILASAKKELELLSMEVMQEKELLAKLQKDICMLAAKELDETDATHQKEQKRCQSLGNSEIGSSCSDAGSRLRMLLSTSGKLSELCEERWKLPERIDHNANQLHEAHEELQRAAQEVQSTLAAIEEPKSTWEHERPIFLQRQQLITQQKQVFQDKQQRQQQLVQEQRTAKEAVSATQRAFESVSSDIDKWTKQWKGLSDSLADLRRQLALNEKQFEQRVADNNSYQDRIKQQAEDTGQRYIRPPELVNTDGINLKNRIEKMENERELAKRELDAVTQRLEPARAAREQAPKNLEIATRHLNENTPSFESAQREFAKQNEEFDRGQQVFRHKEGRYAAACEAHRKAQNWHQRVQTRITELKNESARLHSRQSELESLISANVAEVAEGFDSTALSVGRVIGLLAPLQVPGAEFKAASYAPIERRWVEADGLQSELRAALLGGPSDLATLKAGMSCLDDVRAWCGAIFSSIEAEIERLSRAREGRWQARCISLLGKEVFATLNGSMSTTRQSCTLSFGNR